MTTYEKNVEFLKQHSTDLYHTIQTQEPMFSVAVEKVEQQSNYIMQYNNCRCFVHSIYNITDEMDMMFKNIEEDTEVLILFGLGYGHSLEYITKKYKNLQQLIIIEPSLQIFKYFLSEHDFTKVFHKLGVVSLIVNKDESAACTLMFDILLANTNKKTALVSNISYSTIFQSYFVQLQEELVTALRGRRVGLITLSVTRYQWLENTMKNFKSISILADDVFPLLKGKPVVIVSAGPSLNKHIGLLNELKEKAVLVAVGSAMKILDSHGIQPHFRAAIDGSDDKNIYDEKFYADSSAIPILYASQLYHGLLPEYKGKKIFMMLETDALAKYVYNKLNISATIISSGASVANGAFSFLCEAQCSTVIFLGQDMCFLDNELYAQGRSSDSEDNYKNSRIKKKDINGNDVYTISNYLQIKYDYEGKIKKYPNVKMINATEGGLGIEGTEVKSLRAVLDEDLTEELNFNIEDSNFVNKKEYNEKLRDVFLEIEDEVNTILEINRKRLELLKKFTLKRKIGVRASKLSKEFNYLNRLEDRLEKNPFYTEVIKQCLNGQLIATKLKYQYSGNDKLKQVESHENYLYALTTEVEIYLQVFGELFTELMNSFEEGEKHVQ